MCTTVADSKKIQKLAWYLAYNYEHDIGVSYVLCCACRSLTGRILSMYGSSLALWMHCCMKVKQVVNQSLCAGSVKSGTPTPPTSGTHPSTCSQYLSTCMCLCRLDFRVGRLGFFLEIQSAPELLAPLKRLIKMILENKCYLH